MLLERPQNWFLVRGLVRETADWGDFPQKLAAAIRGARVFCLDLPGTGRHHRRSSPTALSAMVDFTRAEFRAILERRGPDGGPLSAAPSFVLALSLGAMVTLEWMRRFPRELDGAVLVNTSLRGLSPFYKRLSPGIYPTLARIFASRDIRRREQLILRITSQRQSLPQGILDHRVSARVTHPVTRANAVRQILAALLHSPIDAPPASPIVLLNSLGDQLVHPDCSESLRARWNVPMKRHAWAGHDLPLDDPDWTVGAVADWVLSLPEPTRREGAPGTPTAAER
jgi:pimeloyl-ACP methyl ester carboxylesterase